jgi:hypothetical protein
MSYQGYGSYYPINGFGAEAGGRQGSALPSYMRGFGDDDPEADFTRTRRGRYFSTSGFGGAFVDSGTAKWLVGKGDYGLSFIAKQVYGAGAPWKPIYDANKSVIGSNPDLIQPGMILTLPPIPGFPDPQGAVSATKNVAGTTAAVVPAGTTIIGSGGEKIAIGPGGQVVGGGSKTAGMSTGMMIGIGAAAVVVIGGLALMAKKKGGGGYGPPRMTANRRRRHRYA